MFLGDFHIHSNFSDGHLSIPELVDFYGKQNFGAIAITDHICEQKTFYGRAAHWLDRTLTKENFGQYQDVLNTEIQRAWEQYKMIVLPGFEITKNSLNFHKSAHLLALGVTQYIPATGDIIDIIDTIHDCGGLAIAAHPVPTRKFETQTYHLWGRREELAHKFDAWEVASGTVLFNEVGESGLPLIASSDLHHPRQMNSWKSTLNCERQSDAILDAIKQQNLNFQYYQQNESYMNAILRNINVPKMVST